MSDLLNEQLSALIDGELPAQETALLLKRLEREPELRERLARYRVCGEMLRGARVQARSDFSLKVCALLALEPAHAGGGLNRARPARRYLRPVAGLAVAAAVAGAAILVLGRPGGLGGEPAELAARAMPVSAAPVDVVASTPSLARRSIATATFTGLGNEPPSYVTPAPRQGFAVIPRAELAKYVVVHSEVSGPLGLRSALTSLVSDDTGDSAAPAR